VNVVSISAISAALLLRPNIVNITNMILIVILLSDWDPPPVLTLAPPLVHLTALISSRLPEDFRSPLLDHLHIHKHLNIFLLLHVPNYSSDLNDLSVHLRTHLLDHWTGRPQEPPHGCRRGAPAHSQRSIDLCGSYRSPGDGIITRTLPKMWFPGTWARMRRVRRIVREEEEEWERMTPDVLVNTSMFEGGEGKAIGIPPLSNSQFRL
jgi:hypothetical protein